MFAKDEIKQKRLDICKSCEEFIKLTAQCDVCGCFMKVKTMIKSAKCPKGKWNDTK
jgi:hypothetical protein